MKKLRYTFIGILLILIIATIGGSFYMLSYSLSPDPKRTNRDSMYNTLYTHFPYMRHWTDSMQKAKALRDTFIIQPSGERHHAMIAECDTAHGRTTILVHGYKDSSIKFLYMAKMYNDLGYNVILPDLHAHGLSEGDEIQMGWLDRKDIINWINVAEKKYNTSNIILHGVSMGAATVMNTAGEHLPKSVKCAIEDCGYTSVWGEFSYELQSQFGLPVFPLMYTTSMLCKLRYGWSFQEASPLKQVAKTYLPMLFIHGDVDDFVPTRMVKPLYNAHHGTDKELWLTHGAGHAQSFTKHKNGYYHKVMEFTKKYVSLQKK